MVDTYSPGIEYYANRILTGEPFSFLKYGDGEMRLIIPDMPMNPRLLSKWFPPKKFYAEPLRGCPVDENFIFALWRQDFFKKARRAREYEGWLKKNVPDGVVFHDGAVWMDALVSGRLYPIIEAIRLQSRPVIIVGPERLRHLGRLTGWNIERYIFTHPLAAWEHLKFTEEEIRGIVKPALFVFAAGPMKLLIHSLWSSIGHHSTMIDFGSVLDPLCGFCTRQGFWNLTLGTLRRNLGWETNRAYWGSLESERM